MDGSWNGGRIGRRYGDGKEKEGFGGLNGFGFEGLFEKILDGWFLGFGNGCELVNRTGCLYKFKVEF